MICFHLFSLFIIEKERDKGLKESGFRRKVSRETPVYSAADWGKKIKKEYDMKLKDRKFQYYLDAGEIYASLQQNQGTGNLSFINS